MLAYWAEKINFSLATDVSCTFILELTRRKLIFKNYSGFACAEAWGLLCRIPMLKWILWMWLASNGRCIWSAFLAPDLWCHSLAVIRASSDVPIDATVLYSPSNTNWNAKAYSVEFIYFKRHIAAPAYIEVIAWTTPWAWFVDSGVIEDDLE